MQSLGPHTLRTFTPVVWQHDSALGATHDSPITQQHVPSRYSVTATCRRRGAGGDSDAGQATASDTGDDTDGADEEEALRMSTLHLVKPHVLKKALWKVWGCMLWQMEQLSWALLFGLGWWHSIHFLKTGGC
jgi:hypothetical protein